MIFNGITSTITNLDIRKTAANNSNNLVLANKIASDATVAESDANETGWIFCLQESVSRFNLPRRFSVRLYKRCTEVGS